jgi:prophage tail gpP-like protein
MSRLRDKVHIQVFGIPDRSGRQTYGILDNFNSFEITNSITEPSEAAFELGNDTSWSQIEEIIKPGTEYRIFINDRLRLTGRVELTDIPLDPMGGADVQFTIRTKLADAMFASARASIQVKDQSILQFLTTLYTPLGYTESDFIFPNEAYKSRDLITGRNTSGQRSQRKTPDDLEKIKFKEAKVQPPETIYASADRHLRRHGLMHWDSPDGKIVVSAPNDEQNPIYSFRAFTGPQARANNIISATRSRDWSEVPSKIGLFGVGGQRGFSKAKVSVIALDNELIDAGFYRPIVMMAEGIKTTELADRAVTRELSARSKRKDAWDIETDGLSWWNGNKNVPIGTDTTASITSNVAGGPLGAYYVHRVVSRRDASNGDRTNMSLLRRGVWKL